MARRRVCSRDHSVDVVVAAARGVAAEVLPEGARVLDAVARDNGVREVDAEGGPARNRYGCDEADVGAQVARVVLRDVVRLAVRSAVFADAHHLHRANGTLDRAVVRAIRIAAGPAAGEGRPHLEGVRLPALQPVHLEPQLRPVDADRPPAPLPRIAVLRAPADRVAADLLGRRQPANRHVVLIRLTVQPHATHLPRCQPERVTAREGRSGAPRTPGEVASGKHVLDRRLEVIDGDVGRFAADAPVEGEGAHRHARLPHARLQRAELHLAHRGGLGGGQRDAQRVRPRPRARPLPLQRPLQRGGGRREW
mmetsp:Transcript_25804/g.65462  ORF Transcript_25804/g.65462 Transcript_25804/m.65462 type:complete len:309 (-) Transcript_25804:97-1023(-)